MKKIIIPIIILLLTCLLYSYITSDYDRTPPTLYYNANIITVDNAQPNADAMLVVDGVISAIGELEDIDLTNIKNLQKEDLGGATVLPGFIDVHTHFALSMFLAAMHDLSGFKHESNKEVWRYFEGFADDAAVGEYLIFKGLDPILVSDLVPPSIQYLDSIYPDNPVVIFSQSLHNYWANTAAFAKAGVTLDTPDPSSHSYYERDSDGGFTGLVVEQVAFQPFVESIKTEVLTTQLMSDVSEQVMQDYARHGNTTIVSTGLTLSDSKPLILLKHLSDEHPSLLGGLLGKMGQLPARQPRPRHFLYMRHDTPDLLPAERGTPNDFYDIIGVKHWYDGSPYIGTMYMEEPYLDTEMTSDKLAISQGTSGEALMTQAELKDFITTYHQAGWQIAIHTQGDAAIREVIKAYSDLEETLDYAETRHRLEHCLMLPVSILDTMRQLNLTPSFHINHLYYYGDALTGEILGPARAEELLPLRSAIDHELVIVTINAAYQIHKEDKIGSLAQGKYADFIILSDNPLKVEIEEMDQIQCLSTYVNGNKVTL